MHVHKYLCIHLQYFRNMYVYFFHSLCKIHFQTHLPEASVAYFAFIYICCILCVYTSFLEAPASFDARKTNDTG